MSAQLMTFTNTVYDLYQKKYGEAASQCLGGRGWETKKLSMALRIIWITVQTCWIIHMKSKVNYGFNLVGEPRMITSKQLLLFHKSMCRYFAAQDRAVLQPPVKRQVLLPQGGFLCPPPTNRGAHLAAEGEIQAPRWSWDDRNLLDAWGKSRSMTTVANYVGHMHMFVINKCMSKCQQQVGVHVHSYSTVNMCM